MFKRILTWVAGFALVFLSLISQNVFAESTDEEYGIGMSPLSQKVGLSPGDTYTGSLKINNVSDTQAFGYSIEIKPYYVDENYNNQFDVESTYSQITTWTTVEGQNGVLLPQEEKEIKYTIVVPENAPAGGQYMAIMVTSDDSLTRPDDSGSVGISARQAMAFLVYADIDGKTERSGNIFNYSVPGFLMSGKISGTVTTKNTGNVHETATYSLQVFPLFSDEEIYTNEEYPETRTVLPDRALINTISWNETPMVGIFKVIYKVTFLDETTEVSKIVVVCPMWLLITIIFLILVVIFRLIGKAKPRKK